MPVEFTPQDPNRMNYTKTAAEILAMRQLEEGFSESRHVIGRDSPIAEGIYGESFPGETIVVNYEYDKPFYDEIVDEVMEQATVVSDFGIPKVDKDLIMDSVFNITRQKLAYSQEGVDKIFKAAGGQNHQKISLASYVESGVGVCRHQALLAGLLLERIASEGILGGHASVESSMQWPEQGDPAGHAWVRYTNSAGDVFILDPAQNFIGTLDEAMSRKKGWNYLRPDEDAQRRKNHVAEHIADTTEEFMEADKGASEYYDGATSEAAIEAFEESIRKQPKAADLEAEIKRVRESDQATKRDLMTLLMFIEQRRIDWTGNKTMNFVSEDPAIEPLVKSIQDSAIKTDQPFMNQSEFNAQTDYSKPAIVINSLKSEGAQIVASKLIEVPLSSIVSAINFKSWEEGRGSGVLKDDRNSGDVIKDYASRSTDVPEIDNATALIRPDGSVIILTHNSHRVAAAKLRGQQSIGIRNLIIRKAKIT